MGDITDESVARALLKGAIRTTSTELRNSMEDYCMKLKIIMDIKAKSFRNKKILFFFNETYKHGSLLTLNFKFKGTKDHTRKIWLNISIAQQTNYELKTVHRFPVSVNVIDFWQSHDVRGYDVLFYVSKHLIERVILRNQEASLELICLYLRPFTSALSKAIIDRGYHNIPHEFILLSSVGIVTVSTFTDEVNYRTFPILTTAIPINSLSERKIDLFRSLFHECANDSSLVFFIEQKIYDSALDSINLMTSPINYFAFNSGLCGDEQYPVMLSREMINGFMP